MSRSVLTVVAVLLGVAAVAHRSAPIRSRSQATAPPRTPRPSSPATEYLDALELLLLSIRAGLLPLEAMRIVLPHIGPTVRAAFHEVLQHVASGTRFADALAVLPHRLGPRALLLADALSAADRDGLPLAPVLERLSADARSQRRREADALARQLPVRMAFPLVMCSLPSFVLLAVAPMIIAALSALAR